VRLLYYSLKDSPLFFFGATFPSLGNCLFSFSPSKCALLWEWATDRPSLVLLVCLRSVTDFLLFPRFFSFFPPIDVEALLTSDAKISLLFPLFKLVNPCFLSAWWHFLRRHFLILLFADKFPGPFSPPLPSESPPRSRRIRAFWIGSTPFSTFS